MRFSFLPPRRTAAAALAVALITGACGGAADETPVAVQPAAEPEGQAPAVAEPLDPPSDAEAAAAEAEPATPVDEQAAPAPEPVEEPAPTEEAAAEPVEEAAPAIAAVAAALPAVDVVNLADNQLVNLADLAQPGPTLLWFWAPH